MKTCSKCKEEKSEDDFGWRDMKNKRRHSWCRSCRKVWDAESWKNGTKKKTSLKQRLIVEKRNKEYVVEVFLSGCVDCGIKDLLVLEFDHLRDKSKDISVMLKDYSLETLKAEILKCEVVCANCHRKRTCTRAKNWRWQYVSLA